MMILELLISNPAMCYLPLLDAMGDLYILGKPLLAHYRAHRSGHALNNALLRQLQAQPQDWEVVSFDDVRSAPKGFGQLAPAW